MLTIKSKSTIICIGFERQKIVHMCPFRYGGLGVHPKLSIASIDLKSMLVFY